MGLELQTTFSAPGSCWNRFSELSASSHFFFLSSLECTLRMCILGINQRLEGNLCANLGAPPLWLLPLRACPLNSSFSGRLKLRFFNLATVQISASVLAPIYQIDWGEPPQKKQVKYALKCFLISKHRGSSLFLALSPFPLQLFVEEIGSSSCRLSHSSGFADCIPMATFLYSLYFL